MSQRNSNNKKLEGLEASNKEFKDKRDKYLVEIRKNKSQNTVNTKRNQFMNPDDLQARHEADLALAKYLSPNNTDRTGQLVPYKIGQFDVAANPGAIDDDVVDLLGWPVSAPRWPPNDDNQIVALAEAALTYRGHEEFNRFDKAISDLSYSFKGGFTVQDDLEEIAPSAPVKHRVHKILAGDDPDYKARDVPDIISNTNRAAKARTGLSSASRNNEIIYDRSPLVFVCAPPKGVKKGATKEIFISPDVIRSGCNLPAPDDKVYDYKIFKYLVAELVAGQGLEEVPFIFTGSTKTSRGAELVKGLFMPASELKLRLCGTKEQRFQRYLLDWITYLVAKEFYGGGFVTGQEKKILNLITEYVAKEQLKPHQVFDGRHITMRNQFGEVVTHDHTAGIQPTAFYFLYTLLGQPDTCPEYKSEFIFQQWCRVANLASFAPQDPFSVKARFWKFPTIQPGQRITLHYFPPPGLEVIFNSLKESTEPLEIQFVHAFNELGVIGAWQEAIRQSHLAAFTATKISSQNHGTEFHNLPVAGSFDIPNNPLLLGSHPQGFYKIYVSQEGWNQLITWGFPTTVFDPKPLNRIGQKFPGIPQGHNLTTETIITSAKISNAAKTPRCRSQNQVMEGYGAPGIAGPDYMNWDIVAGRSAEWLHRSAYSFGGPDSLGASVNDSQRVENLVFGTYEANTEMIRYEGWLKRLISSKLCKAVGVETRTENPDANYRWFAERLDYEWDFVIPLPWKDCSLVAKNGRKFDLWGRRHSTLFEVNLDEQFDQKWMPDFVTGLAEFSDMHCLVLLMLITQNEYIKNPSIFGVVATNSTGQQDTQQDNSGLEEEEEPEDDDAFGVDVTVDLGCFAE